MSNIVFDNELKQFSVVEDREFAMHPYLKSRLSQSAGRLLDKATGKDRERTFWGRFNGRNRQLDRQDEARHAERMAKIKAGMDPDADNLMVNAKRAALRKLNKIGR